MSDTQIKSPFAGILNALCEMQESAHYASRRSVLMGAEEAIVQLERSCAELRHDIERHVWICAEQANQIVALEELLRAAGKEGLLVEDEVERNIAQIRAEKGDV